MKVTPAEILIQHMPLNTVLSMVLADQSLTQPSREITTDEEAITFAQTMRSPVWGEPDSAED